MELGDEAYFVSAGLVAQRARTPGHRRDAQVSAAAAGEDTGTAGAGREDQQQRDLAAGEGAAEPEVGDDETACEGARGSALAGGVAGRTARRRPRLGRERLAAPAG